MLKRTFIATCLAVFAIGCGSSRNDTTTTTSGTTSGSSSTGNTSASTTSGTSSTGTTSSTTSSGTTTAGTSTTSSSTTSGSTGACQTMTIAQARSPATPAFTEVCLSQVTAVYALSPGGQPSDGGGTAYNGDYYVADSNGDAMLVFKSHYSPVTGDPARGQVANYDGVIKLLPGDAGAIATVELSGNGLTISTPAAGTLPTPKTATFADLDMANPNTAMIGSYVMVPAATSENPADPLMQHTSSGTTYQDGLSLSDGTHTVLVDTYSFFKGSGHDKTCLPTDGGEPDLTGGFKAIFDYSRTPSDGAQRPMLIFGDCSDL